MIEWLIAIAALLAMALVCVAGTAFLAEVRRTLEDDDWPEQEHDDGRQDS